MTNALSLLAAFKPFLEFLSALCAGYAAILWFRSAVVKLPPRFPIQVMITARPMYEGPGAPPAMGEGRSQMLDILAHQLKRQSKLSARAARFAGAAALFQFGAWLIGVVPSLVPGLVQQAAA